MMGSCPKRVALTLFFLLAVQSAFASGVAGGGDVVALYSAAAESGCKGTVGECLMADSDSDSDSSWWDEGGIGREMAMESETARRMLAAAGRYISYGALRRNSVPCSRRGASYYNCRPGAQANPYRRGCSRITRCRR